MWKVFLAINLTLLLAAQAFAAISSTAVWEVRSTATGGANVNGGCYNASGSSPGTDFSQQNGAQYSPSGTLTSAGAGDTILYAAAAADMNRNCIHITAGTNFTVGWYEIIAVSVGVSIQVDRSVTTGVGAAGSGQIGGALSLGSSDDAIFESMTAGNTMWVKGGSAITYTLGGAVNIAAAGTTTSPIFVKAYASSRGDNPTGVTRPTFDTAANTFISGANWEWSFMQFTTTSTTGFNFSTSDKVFSSKFTNTSTTANRNAISVSTGTAVLLSNIEAWSIRGIALAGASTTNIVTVIGSYLHDSDVCVSDGTTSGNSMYINNLIEGCVTTGFNATGAKTGVTLLYGNTLFGSVNHNMGTGINFATGTTNGPRLINNIFYGWTTAVNSVDDLTKIAFLNFNDFNNNATDVTNVTKGASDIATAPAFQNATQVTVTTGTSSNTGNTLTKAGATFQTSGVTAGRDFVYCTAGCTTGLYTISSVDSETQLTLGQAPGNATGTVTASINVGHNMAPGTSMRNKAFPNTFPAALTTSYPSIGAQQAMPGAPRKAVGH